MVGLRTVKKLTGVDRIPACDRRTDKQTGRRFATTYSPRCSYASRGKTWNIIISLRRDNDDSQRRMAMTTAIDFSDRREVCLTATTTTTNLFPVDKYNQ